MTNLPRQDGQDETHGTRIDALTSLRFFAALAIVLHHLRDYGFAPRLLGGLPLDNGVSFFFILSGFVIFLVYGAMKSPEARKAYLVARIARIYPLHLATFVLLFVLLNGDPGRFGTGESSWLAGILNVLLLQAWVPIGTVFFGFNSLSWTISVEMFFYVAFIGLVVDFPRRWPYALAGSAALVLALIVLSDSLHLANYDDPMHRVNAAGLLYINPLTRLFEFVLGMCVALAWMTVRRRRINKGLATLAEIGAVFLFAGNALLVFPISAWFAASISVSSSVWISHGGAICLSTALLIFVIAFQAGFLSALLRLPVLVFLGEISFSIYMVHQILLRSYATHADWFAGLAPPVMLALYGAVLLVTATLLWRIVELPARSFLRGAYARRTGRSAGRGVAETGKASPVASPGD
ncbi:Peptidoglycan/LPS O-acetylase OafA/YrhL, contains acyltransferase and SGNH-hydrolase domains [Kaistia soli DSM 19436]|uniref:Peptidoglycan/LPS O-acetylase OafA/YrhL, contains acyltransferase and SGNH-hydrolase domains n=1 Tax=Kaistia soli DSM 19436 TaxID=1122133 RepID=A0A1M5H633_9HYPH|nr:acyltransferase [Kaistia soli]SHG11378.1 Peptidoglycan/LPS O-acetylase OafA/YrhL, contains acyltransferase and SGNH-hydrolase domains [Kaistia soli DSM 19436]